MKLYPPTISLLNILAESKHQCFLITTKDSEGVESALNGAVKVKYINYTYDENKSLLMKAINIKHISSMLWDSIEELYDPDAILWVESDISIKHLGNKLLGYNYILQMDELNDGIYYSSRYKQFKMNANRIGNSAKAIVVPEYNRAHILKAWWGLEHLPYILPNKPYVDEKELEKTKIPDRAGAILNKLSDKKIVIYQGGLGKERPIFKYVEAVEKLTDYSFVIMSGNYSEYQNRGYHNCHYIDYMVPPAHLKVTEHAYIGIVTYIATPGQNSILNALYCAPNKIFEYARYGIPIIGNDIPGLRAVVNEYKNGVVLSSVDERHILEAIKSISDNYAFYSSNAQKMYEDCDNKATIRRILGYLE